MRKNESAAGRASLGSILKGAVFGIVVTLFILAVTSLLISKEIIDEEGMKASAFIAAYLGSLFGSLTAAGSGKAISSAAAVTGVMILVRFVTSAFGGDTVLSQLSLLMTAALILGGLTTVFFSARRKRRRRTARR